MLSVTVSYRGRAAASWCFQKSTRFNPSADLSSLFSHSAADSDLSTQMVKLTSTHWTPQYYSGELRTSCYNSVPDTLFQSSPSDPGIRHGLSCCGFHSSFVRLHTFSLCAMLALATKTETRVSHSLIFFYDSCSPPLLSLFIFLFHSLCLSASNYVPPPQLCATFNMYSRQTAVLLLLWVLLLPQGRKGEVGLGVWRRKRRRVFVTAVWMGV